MIVIVKVWSTNPDYSAGCDYAVLEFVKDFAKARLGEFVVLVRQKFSIPLSARHITGILRRSISAPGSIAPAKANRARSRRRVSSWMTRSRASKLTHARW